MDIIPGSGWAALIAVMLGVITAAAWRTIAALKGLSHSLEVMQEVMNGRLSQLVALTAVSSEAVGVEKGRVAELARVIAKTLPATEPLLPMLTDLARRNSGELVIEIPTNPTPTVVLIPTDEHSKTPEVGQPSAADGAALAEKTLENATATATRQVEDLHRQVNNAEARAVMPGDKERES